MKMFFFGMIIQTNWFDFLFSQEKQSGQSFIYFFKSNFDEENPANSFEIIFWHENEFEIMFWHENSIAIMFWRENSFEIMFWSEN